MKLLLYKYRAVFICLFFLPVAASAQQRVINGFLRDSVTLFPIANGIITNSTLHKAVKTDEKGFFKIEASPNDFLYASAKSYHYDTLKYSFIYTDTIGIFLSFAGTVLPGVTVRGQYSRYQQDSIDRKRDFDQSRGTTYKTVASNDHPSGFGLTFNLDRVFKQKYRNQKKDETLFTLLEKTAYVNYRYSPNLVAYYTGYKGEKLRNFMNAYTPSYDWFRQHPSNEDVLYYINDKLKEVRAKQQK